MYARYDYNAGASAANVLADIVAILTGTTDVNTLSAACNKTTSTVTSTVAAGWTVFDAAATATSQVLRAPLADSGYKYAEVSVTGTTLASRAYESWNATTHTGTNPSNSSLRTQSAGFSLSAGGTIFLFAAATYLHILPFTGSTYGKPMSVVEITRMSPWDTAANAVPPVVALSTTSWVNWVDVYACRRKTQSFADTTQANLFFASIAGTNQTGYPYGIATKVCDSSGTPQFAATDVYFSRLISGGDFGGKAYGIQIVSYGGATSDDVALGGQTYFYVDSTALGATSQQLCVAFPKF